MSARACLSLAALCTLLTETARAEPGAQAPPVDQLASALEARGAGRLNAAEAMLRRRLAADPADLVARRELALTLAWQHTWPEAIAEYHRVLRGAPDDDAAAIGLARTLSWAGDHAAARAQLRATLARRPSHAEAWAALGANELAAGDKDAAEAAYRRALAIDGASAEAREGLTRLRDALAARASLRVGTALYPALAPYAAAVATWPPSLRTELWARAATVADPDVGTGATAAIGAVHRRGHVVASAGAHVLDAPGLTGLAESAVAIRRGAFGGLASMQLRVGPAEPTAIVRAGPSLYAGGVELSAQAVLPATAAGLGEAGADLAARLETATYFLEVRAVLATSVSAQVQARVALSRRLAGGVRATTRDGDQWLGVYTELGW